MTHFCNP